MSHPLAQYRLVYLATPYSKYKAGLYQAFEDAARLTARLMKAGVPVYSPITHSHPIAFHGDIDPRNHDIWLPFERRLMSVSDALCVAEMDGWRESFGISEEIKIFAGEVKPIHYLDPETLSVSQVPHGWSAALCPTP